MPDFGPPIFRPKNLAPSVTIYYGHLSSCSISEKTNDPILKKLSDRKTEGRADGQTDGHE